MEEETTVDPVHVTTIQEKDSFKKCFWKKSLLQYIIKNV